MAKVIFPTVVGFMSLMVLWAVMASMAAMCGAGYRPPRAGAFRPPRPARQPARRDGRWASVALDTLFVELR